MNATTLKVCILYLLKERYLEHFHEHQFKTEKIGNIVIGHCIGAGAAGMAAGCLSGPGFLAALAANAGFIWSMYYRICKEMDIKLSKSKAKFISSAILSNVLANLGVGLAAYVAGSFIPGIANVLDAVVNFAVVYVAALIFMNTMTHIFKLGKDVDFMTDSELKEAISTGASTVDTKAAFAEAKTAYREAKKENVQGFSPMEED